MSQTVVEAADHLGYIVMGPFPPKKQYTEE